VRDGHGLEPGEGRPYIGFVRHLLAIPILATLVPCVASAIDPEQGSKPRPQPKDKVVLEASQLDVSKPDAEAAVVCFTLPAKLTALYRKRMVPIVIEAAKSSRPTHASFEVIELPAKDPKRSRITTVPCLAIVAIDVQVVASTQEAALELVARDTSTDKELGRAIAPAVPATVTAAQLAPAWTTLWAAIAPAPAPPPPPLADTTPFVDPELKAVQQVEPPKPRRHLLSLDLRAGLLSRSVGAAGTPIDMSGLPSLGADVRFHLDGLIGLALSSPHEIELDVGYARRIAHGVLGNDKPSVDADRFSVSGTYRYRFQSATAVGPTVGFEMLRFEIDPSTGAFSPRYGVLRAGLDARQSFGEGLFVFSLLAQGALRITPGADGGSSDLGFDLGGGPELRIDRSFFARALVRFTSQSGSAGAAAFNDRYVDFDLALGFSL